MVFEYTHDLKKCSFQVMPFIPYNVLMTVCRAVQDLSFIPLNGFICIQYHTMTVRESYFSDFYYGIAYELCY